MAELIDPDDLLDAEAVADLLGLASAGVISVYASHDEALPRLREWLAPRHRLHLDLASLSVAEFYADNQASVRLVNDTSYLRRS